MMKLGRKKFIELFDFKSKSKIQAKDGLPSGKYPFYTSSNIQSKFIDEYNYEGESLIFGTGGKASVHFEKGRFSTSTDCLIAQANDKNQIDVNYSFYYFKSNPKILEDGFHGAGLKHISKSYISEITIPLPPLSDQIRIAEILSQAESLIAQRKQSISLLDELLKSTFLEMFGDPVRNEKGWEIVKLKDLVIRLDTGKSIQSVEKESAGEYKVLKTSSVSWGRFIKEESKWLPLEYIPPKNHLIEKGNILMSRMNTTELVGASTFVFDDVKNLALPDRIWKFILSEENKVNSLFLWYCINWNSFRKVISEISSGTSGSMKNITKEGILNLKVIYPNLKIQNQFSVIVEKVETLKSHYQQSLTELQNMYGVLSQKAFKGELSLDKKKLKEKV